ncbi:hypothetical protein DFH06DRAFT_563044 [Mycena polygramma]|nr:hypothetical protein DFH06DRAFT_563044 [Mycena polygramma]
MAEIALINMDKCEVIDPTETGHGYKMKEAIANWMTTDIVWLFAVPVDNQPAPPPGTAVSEDDRDFDVRRRRASVPVGHWAGDRVLIVDEYSGPAEDYLPPDVLAKYPNADPQDDVLDFALTNLKHVGLAHYKPAEGGAPDVLFPADRLWVVRNLTDRWYARADVLVKAKHRQGPAASSGLGLSDVIWTGIGGGMNGKHSVGHRFDIQTLESIEGSENKEQWANKSEDMKHNLDQFNMEEFEELRGGDESDYY